MILNLSLFLIAQANARPHQDNDLSGDSEQVDRPDADSNGVKIDVDRCKNTPHQNRDDKVIAPTVEPDRVHDQPYDGRCGHRIDENQPVEVADPLLAAEVNACKNDENKGSDHPNELGATTSSSDVLGFCGTKGYSTLFAGRPGNKGRTNKLASARSRLAINLAPAKVSVRESAEQEGGGS